MKKIIKNLIYKLQDNPISKYIYTSEIRKRSRLPLTEINKLAKNINIFSSFSSEIHKPNDWYGHAKVFKKFLGLKPQYKFKFLIEHRVYLTEQVDDIDVEANLPSIITYSDFRAKVLKKYRQNVFSIGPFIHYAESFLNEEKIKKEKRRLGKTLLVFPSHSSFFIGTKYDSDWLCQQAKRLGKDFDSIRVCLYWADILFKKDKIYKKYGFECVTAGHMLDPLFLPRLKSIIQTSDATISNTAGTHVGYSVFLGKPHIIFLQKPKLIASKNWRERIENFWQSKPFKEVVEAFSKETFRITPLQKKLVETYWGTNLIKTKAELLKIVNKTEKIYQERNQ